MSSLKPALVTLLAVTGAFITLGHTTLAQRGQQAPGTPAAAPAPAPPVWMPTGQIRHAIETLPPCDTLCRPWTVVPVVDHRVRWELGDHGASAALRERAGTCGVQGRSLPSLIAQTESRN